MNGYFPRKLWCVFGLLVLFASLARADTTYVAPGSVSGTWTSAGSPYILHLGDVHIPSGSSLTIEPGVTVYFAGPYKIISQGQLRAMGTSTDSVRFTTDTLLNPARWRGLTFFAANGDTSLLNYCIFEYGGAQGNLWYDSCGGAFRNITGRVIASHSAFRHNRASTAGGAVYGTVATTILDNCEFTGNYALRGGGAVYMNAADHTRVAACSFTANLTDESGGGMMLFQGHLVMDHSQFRLNRCGSQGGALMLIGVTGTLYDCVIDSNASLSGAGGMYISDSTTALIIDSCLITNNQATTFTGGVYCWESAPVFRHCQFLNNSCGARGGGLNAYRWGAAPVLEGCTLRGNRCSNSGGGLWCATFAELTLLDCDVSDNWAAGSGGGLWSENSATVILDGCRIDSNNADRNGGGVACRVSTLSLTNCTVEENQADSSGGGIWVSSCTFTADSVVVTGNAAAKSGGGIYVSDSSPLFDRLTCTGNSAGLVGGGLRFENAPAPELSRSRFIQNSALDGGGIGSKASGMRLENSLITDNHAENRGGGLFLDSTLTTTLIYCTVARNSADSLAGNLYCRASPSALKNSIFAYSHPVSVCVSGSIAPEITFCCFYQGDITGALPSGFGQVVGTNANGDSCDGLINIFYEPLFADTASGDWHLRADSAIHSPCIGAAGPGGSVTDLDGNSRPNPSGSLPDIGAFESSMGHDDGGIFGPLSGTLGPGYFRVVGDLSLETGSSLVISPGTTLQFVGPYRFEIRGTLQANGTAVAPITFTCDTVLTPNRWRGLRFFGTGSSASLLTHVTVEHSYAVGSGGGLYCGDGASPTFRKCTLRRNKSPYYGGGAAAMSASPTFDSCVVVSNWCGQIGGGLYFGRNSNSNLIECDLSGNRSDGIGGGVACMDDAAPRLMSCLISGNESADRGGGYYGRASRSQVSRCLIVGNISGISGGGMFLSLDSSQVTNCTLADNSAPAAGGIGLAGGIPEVNSTIIAFNFSGLRFENAAAAEVLHCLVNGNGISNIAFANGNPVNGPPSLGVVDTFNLNGDPSDRYQNIFLNPQFTNQTEGDYHLLPLSPAVDGGDPELPRDSDQTVVDIGAFHVLQDLTVVPRSLRFGDAAIGDTLTRSASLHNWSPAAVTLFSVISSLPQFRPVPNLAGTVLAPGDSLVVGVDFTPDVEQAFVGELQLLTDAAINDTVIVRLFGNGGIIPAPVKDLTVRVSQSDVILRWSPVDTTIYGNPLEVDTYWIFEYASLENSPQFVAQTGDTVHVIPGAAALANVTFYTVFAVIAGRSRFLLGEEDGTERPVLTLPVNMHEKSRH